jgi:hypothetical protein
MALARRSPRKADLPLTGLSPPTILSTIRTVAISVSVASRMRFANGHALSHDYSGVVIRVACSSVVSLVASPAFP